MELFVLTIFKDHAIKRSSIENLLLNATINLG